MKNHKKQIGIWLDYKEAFIISLDEAGEREPVMQHILSEIDRSVPKGGSRSKTPWGPQGGVKEQAFLRRRQQEEKNYFHAIMEAIDPKADELVIFGPAEAKIGLQNAMAAVKHFHPQPKAVLPADSMTQNQIKARVRDYFATELVV
ncbi:MAG: hypothetical protein EP344_19280 [Bacteroidetes bacterium]|nr:MAG: hypothetical protein EP344_19280 [Bacteroidota bacterium]